MQRWREDDRSTTSTTQARAGDLMSHPPAWMWLHTGDPMPTTVERLWVAHQQHRAIRNCVSELD